MTLRSSRQLQTHRACACNGQYCRSGAMRTVRRRKSLPCPRSNSNERPVYLADAPAGRCGIHGASRLGPSTSRTSSSRAGGQQAPSAGGQQARDKTAPAVSRHRHRETNRAPPPRLEGAPWARGRNNHIPWLITEAIPAASATMNLPVAQGKHQYRIYIRALMSVSGNP
jgi:hypothetical protein